MERVHATPMSPGSGDPGAGPAMGDRREWFLDEPEQLDRIWPRARFSRIGSGPFRAYVARRALATVWIEGLSSSPIARRSSSPEAAVDPSSPLFAYVVLEGRMHVSHDRSTLDADVGDMFLTRVDSAFDYRCPRGVKLFRTSIAEDLLPPRLRNTYEPALDALPHSVATRALRRLAQDLLAGAPPNALSVAAASHLENALISLQQGVLAEQLDDRQAPDDRYDELRQDVIAHIETHLRDPGLSPQTLADRFSISLRLLHKLFEMTPETAAHRIRRRRVEEAASILRDRSVPVAELAADLGFGSVSTFQRAFTSQQGSSPQRYRDEWLNRAGREGSTVRGRVIR